MSEAFFTFTFLPPCVCYVYTMLLLERIHLSTEGVVKLTRRELMNFFCGILNAYPISNSSLAAPYIVHLTRREFECMRPFDMVWVQAVYVCVCVCVRVRERERAKEKQRGGEKGERVRDSGKERVMKA
jgi:hypothetical protein